jgi:integrase
MNTWKRHFGDKRLDKITALHIRNCRNERLESVAARTVNLELNELRQLLNLAHEQKLVLSNVAYQVKNLSAPAEEKRLVAKEEIERLVEGALKMKNGRQLADFLLLATYSGARQKEILQLKWSNINWQSGHVHFEAQTTKKLYAKDVNFNPLLEAHLKDMHIRRKDEVFLFPSARGERIKSYFHTIRSLAKNTGIQFTGHLLRHYFISQLVMKGYNFKLIANWVGHKDGGRLIAERYGHLNDSHRKEMAAKVDFL